MSHIVTISFSTALSRILSPRTRPMTKVRPEVIRDPEFQALLAESMEDWKKVRDQGLHVLKWWEMIVKPGIRKLAMKRSKEINWERRGELNLLFLLQSYLARRLQKGELNKLGELRKVQDQIQSWYQKEGEKLVLQARTDEVLQEEKVRIYHHALHKKHMKSSSILRLQVEDQILEGHQACADFLASQVEDLLLHPGHVDPQAWDIMLNEVCQVFTTKDIENLMAPTNELEVLEVLSSSNQLAAPGTDGLPSLLYSVCWDTLGESLTSVVQAIHEGGMPTDSMRTSIMVFGTKPKKADSLKPGDKRRISLLNSDFKVVTGVEARRFGKTATHTLSPMQLVAGENRRIHHGINMARDAIQAVCKSKMGCGLLDLDFLAGFDWLIMDWVYAVLEKKGVPSEVVNRVKRLYQNCSSIVMVNNVKGKSVPNKRGSLRQGDVPSMYWFGIGIDPLLVYLERRLQGIPIYSLPLHGPTTETSNTTILPPLTQNYKVYGYADDVKPAITSMNEFLIVNKACTLLEGAAGVKLHRDPTAGKVKFLPLGRWKGVLQQEDLPNQCQFICVSDHLDFVGVELRATFSQTRRVNSENLVSRVKNTVGPWKSGKFMPVTQRSYSANTYALSKVWFRCSSINLRVSDISAINKEVKSWLFQDMLQKPSELVLYRDTKDGGLGLFNVQIRSQALMIRAFMETSANPKFQHSMLHEGMYRYHVLEEKTIPDPGFTPYYNSDFFSLIQHYQKNSSIDIATLTTKQWYSQLLKDMVLCVPSTENLIPTLIPPTLIPIRPETISPSTDWLNVWPRIRLRGLTSESSSFLFKLVHLLLPTRERTVRLGVEGGSPTCKMCDMGVTEDIKHALVMCPSNREASLYLMNLNKMLIPDVTVEAFLHLDLGNLVDKDTELAVSSILGTGLHLIWSERMKKRKVQPYQVRAELEALITILRKTRHRVAAEQILNYMLT